MDKRTGLTYACISSILSSIGWVFYAIAVRELTPLIAAAAVHFLGGAILVIYAWRTRQLPSWGELRTSWRIFLAVTILRPIVGPFFFAYALLLTPSIKVMFFTKAEPYFVLLWFWILERQKISSSHLVLLLIHVAGALLLSTGGTWSFDDAQKGDVLVLIGVIAISVTYSLGKDLSEKIGPLNASGITQCVGGLALFPLAVYLAEHDAWRGPSIGWIHVVIIALMYNVLSHTMWFAALTAVRSWMVSAFRAVGPLVAAPFAWLILGETLSVIQIFGAFIVLLTSVLLARAHMQNAD